MNIESHSCPYSLLTFQIRDSWFWVRNGEAACDFYEVSLFKWLVLKFRWAPTMHFGHHLCLHSHTKLWNYGRLRYYINQQDALNVKRNASQTYIDTPKHAHNSQL